MNGGESCKFKNPPGISPIEATRLLCYDRQPVARPALPGASAGGVAEWSIAPVLKTGKGKPFVSSNLTASAKPAKLSRWP